VDNLVSELEMNIEGEVRFDEYSRILYSTDASIYKIKPIGVVIPQHKEDVIATAKIANENGVPLIPRGAGTGLAGQAIGEGIIVDMSKYMNRILEVNEASDNGDAMVRVQPGVVLDELNVHLKDYGLMFGPDVATSNRANIGGMIGNNSSGARSIIYGKTVDNVLELTVVLSNGDEVVFKPLSGDELQAKIPGDNLESQIYQEVKRIVDENREEIKEKYPKIMRRVAGYNLDEFVEDTNFDISKLIVGSEGTLATVVEAKLKVVQRPKMTALDVVHFNDLIQAMVATNEALDCNPSAVELVDKTVLDLTKDSIKYSKLRTFLRDDPEAILIVEFYGDSEEELLAKIDNLEERFKEKKLGYTFVRAFDADEISKIWQVRKAGLALLMGMKGDAKPAGFVEDTAVAPEKLPEYIQRFQDIISGQATTAAYYAHASVGCLHIRPILNLKTGEGIAKMRSIAEQVADLVMEFGGTMSAEHGDGLARSEFTEKMFGTKLYQAFQEVKRAFDPTNIMNPGRIVDAPPMSENLRYGADYKAIQLDTYFDFSKDGGFDRAIEMCSGVGVCRKMLEGVMCPSFMVTREEEHSTRGRANALRAALCGDLPEEALTGRRLYEVLDLCLACKSCKSECPANVDMAKLKFEFLAHYYKENGLPLRNWLFGNIEKLDKVGCFFAPLSNWVMRRKISKWAFDKFVGIDKRRDFPIFARQTFEKWFSKRAKVTSPKKVVLFHDTYLNYNEPNVGIAVTDVLEKSGFEVILPDKKCCGKPMISKGMVKNMVKNAVYNVERLAEYAGQGIPIVGCEPSCILTIRDDYLDLIDDERAKLVSDNTYTIEEFLLMLYEKGELNLEFNDTEKNILLHGHCYQKAYIGTAPSLQILSLPPGYKVEEIKSGCCGMAGAFGYEKEHYDFSMEVGNLQLFKAIREAEGEFDIVAAGTSCRNQIKDGTGKRAKHFVEVLAEALNSGG